MCEAATPTWFAATLNALVGRRDLSGEEMTALVEGLLAGSCGPAETEALLVAFNAKGETAEELAAAASVLRRRCRRLDLDGDLLDTCGTGGDSSRTFNISTATALVVAACGVKVVKHGNRAISSASGSADVLAELGVTISPDPAAARRCLEGAGIAFCMAPLYHPALRHVGEVRRRLGVPTMFNRLGPLANPACAPYQLLGVGRADWLDQMAAALARLGTRHAVLVHSRDGLDEVSLSAPTLVRRVCEGEVTALEWAPEEFGLELCSLAELRVEGPAASAAVIRAVLGGDEGAAGRVVRANAAAALFAVGAVSDLRAGVARAGEAIASGRAREALRRLVELSSIVG
jgi:anthranilate phosphoribosyltransferase